MRVDQSCGLSVQQIDGEVPVLGLGGTAQRRAVIAAVPMMESQQPRPRRGFEALRALNADQFRPYRGWQHPGVAVGGVPVVQDSHGFEVV